MRVDLLLIPDAPAKELVRRARCAEEMGFAAIRVADHLAHPSARDALWFECWTILGAIAAATSRVRLGPMVSTSAFRSPAALALQAVSVDHLSEGRLELGLGAGGAPDDFTMAGSAVPAPRERFARFTETVDIVDSLLTTGAVAHHGEYYDVHARAPRPVQAPRPPLVLAAHGGRALQLAARRADCVNTYAQGGDAVEVIRQRMRAVDAECRANGRDPETLRRSVATFFGLSEPLPERDEFAAWARPYEEMGVQEFVLYWPRNESPEKLAELPRASS